MDSDHEIQPNDISSHLKEMPPPPPPGARPPDRVSISSSVSQVHHGNDGAEEKEWVAESAFLLAETPAELSEEKNAYKGDSTFIQMAANGTNRPANRYKPWRRRKWLMHFAASSAVLVVLAGAFLSMLDRGWEKMRSALMEFFPEPIIDEVQEPIFESIEMVSMSEVESENPPSTTVAVTESRYEIQRETLSYEDEYREYIDSLGLKNISASAVIRPHRNVLNGVKNELPPKRYWKRLKATLEVVDALQEELGVPLRMINSAYRSPKYNAQCKGAAANSFHTKNMALDLVFACSPRKAARVAKKMRDRGDFKGGIGVYSGFIHVDTRGKNATWGIPV